MAERSFAPRPSVFGLPWQGTRLRDLAARVPTGVPLGLLVWRAVTAPFWAGADVPAPVLPARERPLPSEAGLAGAQVRRLLDVLVRRIWIGWVLTVLVRSVWLTLAVGCAWLLVELNGGPELAARPLVAAGVVIVAIGQVFVVLARPSRLRVARMLDRSFRLHDRLATALGNLGREVPADGERASVVYLQVADAANVIAEVRRHPAFRVRPPLREVVLTLTAALLMAALFFLRGVGGGIPELAAGGVPEFVPAAERLPREREAAQAARPPDAPAQAPTVAEVQARAARSNAAQRDLQALAEALEDRAVTRAAADAIGRGDYEAAAQELRDLADEAAGLSSEAREGLADDLDRAAEEMSPGGEELASAARDAADGLRAGGEPAQEGVQELGDAVEETGNQVTSQQELAEQLRQAQSAEGSQGETGQEGGSQEEATGQEGEQGAGDPQAGADRQPGEAQAQAGEGDAQAGEPGEGQEAQPGEGDAAEGQSGESAAGQRRTQGQGQGEEGASQRAEGEGAPGQPGAPGEPQPGDAQEGQPGPGSEAAGETSERGGGAGSGDSQSTDGTEGGNPSDAGQTEGVPPEERVTEATDADGDGVPDGPEGGQDAVELTRTAGEGVQTSTNNGSSSLGSGTGVMVASGSTTQGTVGEAGPDSNRVPAGYRDMVEDYFSDPEGE